MGEDGGSEGVQKIIFIERLFKMPFILPQCSIQLRVFINGITYSEIQSSFSGDGSGKERREKL